MVKITPVIHYPEFHVGPVYAHVGCPKIVRADKGTENAKVSFLQPFLRYQSTDGDESGENSFL